VGKALLDTDIFSEVLKGIDRGVAVKAESYLRSFGAFTLSVISIMEVVQGFQRRQDEQRVQEFLARLPTLEVLTFGIEDAQLSGRIYGDLRRTGQPIGANDPMIAATAIRQGLTLVTGNTDHFQRIKNLGYPLTLDNWRSA